MQAVLDMSATRSRLLELPQELLDNTVAYLGFEDLLRLRVLCLHLDATARRFLLLRHLQEIRVTYSESGLRQAAALLR